MRLLRLTAAIAALSFGASAGATPFSFSASEVDRTEPASEPSGFVETVVRATAGAFGIELTAGDKRDDDLVLRYYGEKQSCESKTQDEQQTEAEPEEKKAPVGPEPIYFGF